MHNIIIVRLMYSPDCYFASFFSDYNMTLHDIAITNYNFKKISKLKEAKYIVVWAISKTTSMRACMCAACIRMCAHATYRACMCAHAEKHIACMYMCTLHIMHTQILYCMHAPHVYMCTCIMHVHILPLGKVHL